MRRGRLLACLWLALAGSPALAGDEVESAAPGQRPPAGSEEDELWYAMERAELELKQHPLLVRDEALNDYVRQVACRVAEDYCADLRVYIVEQPYFNASMAPNGMMMVWTGALLRFQDEAEMALVLGHEFAHFRERHSLEQWKRAKASSAFLGAFGLLAFGTGVGTAGYVASLLGAAQMYSYSRDAEREADRLGFAFATGQGYDPEAGARVWQRMQEEESVRTYGKPLPVFASHPKTAERLEDVRAAAVNSGAQGGETRRDEYRAVMRPFVAEWLEGELSRRMYDSSLLVIGELRESGDPALEATYAFFLGEALRRRGKPGDSARAEALYEEAVALPDPPPAAFREHGLALRAQGRREEASAALAQYLIHSPEAEDAAFVRQYLQEMEAIP